MVVPVRSRQNPIGQGGMAILSTVKGRLSAQASLASLRRIVHHLRNDFGALSLNVFLPRLIWLWISITLWASYSFALDPSLDVSQYAHTAWKVRDGFTQTSIKSVAQTPDGYLWLGTSFGLYRFDGVRAVPWQPPTGQQLPGNNIQSLLVAGDGTLWISTLSGVASWKDGQLKQYPEVVGQIFGPLMRDWGGKVWLGAESPGRLCAAQVGKVQCYGAGTFGQMVRALYEDHDRNLWIAGETGIWRWGPGIPTNHPFRVGMFEADGITEDDRGRLLLATGDGLKELDGGRIQTYQLPGLAGPFKPRGLFHIPAIGQSRALRFFRSRDGSMWIATLQGLLHVHQGRTDIFRAADGLSGDFVSGFLEDREGNVWVNTESGLDRFRRYVFEDISADQRLSTSDIYSVQATSDGTIWIGSPGGVYRWKDGRINAYRGQAQQNGREYEDPINIHEGRAAIEDSGLAGIPASLGQDDRGRLWASTSEGVFYLSGRHFIRVSGVPGGGVFGIAGDGQRGVWISHGTKGLFHVAPGEYFQQIPWSQLGRKGSGARALLPNASDGGVWLGFFEGGLIYLKDNQIRVSYTSADGLGKGRVNGLRFGAGGTLWASTEGGLSRIRHGRILTVSKKDGLPCDEAHWSVEDVDHFVWLSMPCGLVRVASSELDDWVSDSSRKLKLTVFDNSDGAVSVGIYGSIGPHVTQSPDATIWFVQTDGVSVINPRNLPFNQLRPPVHIERVIADRKSYDLESGQNANVELPPRLRNLEIDYTALSLVAPQKVRFRYKLEGRDTDWQDADTRRAAFYTDLSPRKYRFHVIACNNDGVWNEIGASLDFAVAPAWFQTMWFRLLCVLAFGSLIWLAHTLRLRSITWHIQGRLGARIEERERIARELHDTLLQSFQGAVFQFQAARRLLLRNTDNAMQVVDEAIQAAEQGITEGRAAIHDLRPDDADQRDLPQLLKATGDELTGSRQWGGNIPTFSLVVEGKQRDLSLMLQTEIYMISREVIRNAFAHAVASHIEVEIRYDRNQLQVRIRDDGKGINSQIIKSAGRSGHWGIPGMRERAQRIGAHLDFWSEEGAGTEIQLTLPASVAYTQQRHNRRYLFHRSRKDDQHT